MGVTTTAGAGGGTMVGGGGTTVGLMATDATGDCSCDGFVWGCTGTNAGVTKAPAGGVTGAAFGADAVTGGV